MSKSLEGAPTTSVGARERHDGTGAAMASMSKSVDMSVSMNSSMSASMDPDADVDTTRAVRLPEWVSRRSKLEVLARARARVCVCVCVCVCFYSCLISTEFHAKVALRDL